MDHKALDQRLDDRSAGLAQMGEILGELSLVYVDRKGRSRGLFGHLPLAVGGQVAEVLVEFLRRHALPACSLEDCLR